MSLKHVKTRTFTSPFVVPLCSHFQQARKAYGRLKINDFESRRLGSSAAANAGTFLAPRTVRGSPAWDPVLVALGSSANFREGGPLHDRENFRGLVRCLTLDISSSGVRDPHQASRAHALA